MKLTSCIILVVLTFQVPDGRAQDCACGPTYCTDTPQYYESLKKKKADAIKSGLPARVAVLYDRLDHCEAALKTAPDSANLLRRDKQGVLTVDGWTSENEKIGAKALKSGELTACYVILSRRAFSCCGGADYLKRPDYDASLDLNKQGALLCSE